MQDITFNNIVISDFVMNTSTYVFFLLTTEVSINIKFYIMMQVISNWINPLLYCMVFQRVINHKKYSG